LNFRSSPGIHENWMRTNIPGTKVQVIGGPECVPHFTGAYVWWQIKLPDGQIGWSAESSQFGSFYFMEPEWNKWMFAALTLHPDGSYRRHDLSVRKLFQKIHDQLIEGCRMRLMRNMSGA
jgi:hypothetical protein